MGSVRGIALAALLGGCIARIPPDRYGVSQLTLEGVDSFDDNALRACLATAERDRVNVDFFVTSSDLTCGEPPFNTIPIQLPLWKWWWTEWPLFDENVFERDLQRIERWYRARGYYDAHVTSARFDPPAAHVDDHVEANAEGSTPCERESEDEGCRVSIAIGVEEGEPVLVSSIELSGHESLPRDLRNQLRATWRLQVGDRFDEAFYDQSKIEMRRALLERAYGCAEITGDVEVDVARRQAKVHFGVAAGPESVIGEVAILGNESLSETVIRSVAGLETGTPFRESELRDAQHSVYGLGAFASVEVIGRPRRENEVCTGVVDVQVVVTPGRIFRYGLGGGFETATAATGTAVSTVQNNIHASAFVEHRDFLGGLRRMRAEVRPKLLFTRPSFTENLSLGADARLEFRQPAFIESRTTAVLDVRNDFGNDPFETDDPPLRNLFDVAPSIRRAFLSGRLSVSIGAHLNLYRIVGRDRVENADGVESRDYGVFFLEQRIAIDLRDTSPRPRRVGAYAEVDVHEAVAGSWRYVRVAPDFRLYVPLGPLMLAGRFALGSMHILRPRQDEDSSLDENSRAYGPNPFRLRAGGGYSHRGFVAGFLGDGDPWNVGGVRRWEASLELRAPVTQFFGLSFFADAGDVNRNDEWRFYKLRLGLGGGLRGMTPIGVIRIEVAFLVRSLQDLRAGTLGDEAISRHNFLGRPGALQISLGEAF